MLPINFMASELYESATSLGSDKNKNDPQKHQHETYQHISRTQHQQQQALLVEKTTARNHADKSNQLSYQPIRNQSVFTIYVGRISISRQRIFPFPRIFSQRELLQKHMARFFLFCLPIICRRIFSQYSHLSSLLYALENNEHELMTMIVAKVLVRVLISRGFQDDQ